MPFFVLKSVTPTGQTRFVASLRNGRPRVVAFERVCDAKTAVSVVRRDAIYESERVETCETNGTRLSSQFGGADIGIDFCVIDETGSELGIDRSVLLKSRRRITFADTESARDRLERDFDIDLCEEDAQGGK
jgi:hypothetical protein